MLSLRLNGVAILADAVIHVTGELSCSSEQEATLCGEQGLRIIAARVLNPVALGTIKQPRPQRVYRRLIGVILQRDGLKCTLGGVNHALEGIRLVFHTMRGNLFKLRSDHRGCRALG